MITKAKWITAGANISAPCILKQFDIQMVKSAKLFITGLGYFICEINGQSVSEDLFMPVFSDYKKREFANLLYPLKDNCFKHRVYYLEFDVTKLLVDGLNKIEVYLGNGWYNQTKRTVEGKLSFGDSLITKFCLEIEKVDGNVVYLYSDGSEKWRETEVLQNNIFYGEIHDLALKHNCEYQTVSIFDEFETTFTLQTCPNERVIREIKPVLVKKNGNRYIYDAGENITGWAFLNVKGKDKERVVISYAGNLDVDTELDGFSSGAFMKNDKGEEQLQQDTFILTDVLCMIRPKFSRHCFRYFEIKCSCALEFGLIVQVVHTDNAVNSTFKSSSRELNWIYDAFVRTELDNMHDGFPSDCPHRERLGYTGDGQITALSAMITLDAKDFYQKWMQDIVDCQSPTGLIHHTAPFMGGGGGPGGWSGAVVFLPYAYFKRYNDTTLFEKYLNNIFLWLEYMDAHSENYLVVSAEEGSMCLGDWAYGGEGILPPPFVNSCLYVLALENIKTMLVSTNRLSKISQLNDKIVKIKNAILENYYNLTSHRFCEGKLGADSFAIQIGLGDEKTLSALAEQYSNTGWIDTGFLGAYYLIKTFLENGYVNLAYELLCSHKLGCYGYMMESGATTINEHLTMGKYASDCHPMFGSVCELLFTHIVGLSLSDRKKYLITPRIPDQLDFAKCSIVVDGEIVTAGWKKTQGKTIYQVIIPKGFNARLEYNSKMHVLQEGENVIEL